MLRPTYPIQRSTQYDYESSSDERFYRLDIRYPVCFRFQSNHEDGEICQCNRSRKHHKEPYPTGRARLEKPENLKWDRTSHVRPKREEAHGRLINGALYARIDITTELNIVKEILFDVWKLPKPKMIMSIIGGGKYFTLSDRLETNLINGIINLAIRSNIWMITNGYNNGLIQLIGEALHKAKIREPKKTMVALAIRKWGSVKYPENLIKGKKKLNANDNSDDDDEKKAWKDDEHDLGLNHNHYLMLDDAIYQHIDTEDYRTRLCNRIAKIDQENEFHTPVVTLVVDGGDSTISNIYYDLKSNIPVVIMNGSGRVADFFSRWLLYTKDFDNDSKQRNIIYGIDELKPNHVEPIPAQEKLKTNNGRIDIQLKLHQVSINLHSKKLSDLFSKHKTKLEKDLEKTLYHDKNSDMGKLQDANAEENDFADEITIACERVMFCLQPSIRSNITVFNLKSDNNLSDTILKSIAKSYEKLLNKKKDEKKHFTSNNIQNNSKKKDQVIESSPLLELAMDWDCIDVAKEFVLQNSLENIPNIEDAFKEALKKNLYTFIDEFIKLGLNPTDIFFPRDTFTKGIKRYDDLIKDLYNDKIVDHPKTHLKSFIEADGSFHEDEIDSIIGLNTILRILIGDYMHKLYFDSLKEEDHDRTESRLTKRPIETGLIKSKDYESIRSLTDEEKNQMAHDYIMRDLFIWSILMNYTEMSKVLLSHMKYRICPALIATKILKQYHEKATYGELKDGYMESAKYFEQYAINCLDKCADRNADLACEIILQRNELYGYVTCLQVAHDAKDKLFIAAPCCVQAMYNVWFDKIYSEQIRKRDHLNLALGFLTLGLAAPTFVTYRECKQEVIGETLKPSLRSNGINYSDPYPLEYPRYIESNPPMNRYLHKVINFHQSLLIKFCYHSIVYCFFLLLFSYVLLFNFNPPTNQSPSIHWTEILTILLVSSMLIEEIHYFFSQDSLTFPGKFRHYFRDLFKSMTLSAFILFYIGLIVRFTDADTELDFTAARIIMAIDVEIWWLRSLSFIIVIPFLGPHLVAITQMLKDLLFFICIILVVMIGYGVASRSMVYYPIINNFTTATGGSIDPNFDGRTVFRQILYPVYYFLHGDLGNELPNLDSNPNAGWSIATHVLLAFHMLFVNVLLTNLLIAIFSKRYDQVHEDTKNIWHSQQYLFTREYYRRSPFIPPISLIYDIYYLCRMFIFYIRTRFFHGSADRHVRVFKMIPKNKQRILTWYEFEGASTYEYAHAEVKALKNALKKSASGQDSLNEAKNQDMIDKQKDRSNVVDHLRKVQEGITTLDTTIKRMKGEFDTRVTQNNNN